MPIGKIIDFQGSWMSGLATLVVENEETGQTESIFCDNSPTVRALAAAFGGVIGPGHTANVKAIRGKRINYSTDNLGLGILEGFDIVE